MRKRRAFTLIELLVVISIIALLVAMLVPSLSRARTLARKSATLANLHNIGVAMASYESEYNDEHPTNLVDGNEDGRAFMGLELLAKCYDLDPNLFINPNTADRVATVKNATGWPVLLDIGGVEITLDQTGYPPVIDASNIQQVNWHTSFAYDHERKRNGNVNQSRVYVGDRADYKAGRYFSGNWGGEGMCLLWTDGHAAFSTVSYMADQGDPCIYRHNEWAADGSGEGQVFPNPGNVVVTKDTVDTHLRVFSENEDDALLPNP